MYVFLQVELALLRTVIQGTCVVCSCIILLLLLTELERWNAELRMLCKRMNKTFLFLLWNFMHFKLCSHVTKTELIIGHSGPRVGSCVTLWAHWRTPDRCLRRTRRFIDGTVRISSRVRRVQVVPNGVLTVVRVRLRG